MSIILTFDCYLFSFNPKKREEKVVLCENITSFLREFFFGNGNICSNLIQDGGAQGARY